MSQMISEDVSPLQWLPSSPLALMIGFPAGAAGAAAALARRMIDQRCSPRAHLTPIPRRNYPHRSYQGSKQLPPHPIVPFRRKWRSSCDGQNQQQVLLAAGWGAGLVGELAGVLRLFSEKGVCANSCTIFSTCEVPSIGRHRPTPTTYTPKRAYHTTDVSRALNLSRSPTLRSSFLPISTLSPALP